MTCTRCAGLMVSDSFIDLQETGHLWMKAWRCMNCGCIADAIVEQNRRLQAAGRVDVKKGSESEAVSAVSDESIQQAA
jgi:hypothetical protein